MGETRKPSIMQQGHADDFQTDPAVLAPLYPHLKRLGFKTIWECAAGKGMLADDLEANGYRTMRSDILTGQDFLKWEPGPIECALCGGSGCGRADNGDSCACGWCQGWGDVTYDAIITNPPYKPKDEFLARAYALGSPFAFLLPFAALEGRKRQALYRQHGLEVVVLPKRPTFITPNGTVGGAWFAAAWFTYRFDIGQALTFWESSP